MSVIHFVHGGVATSNEIQNSPKFEMWDCEV